MRFAQAVVKHRVLILLVAAVLMIPAVLGMVATRVNYDMLDYLPADMDTVKGQDLLLEDFGKGAFSLIIVENMPDKEVARLVEKLEQVEHVETVLWYSSLLDLSIPKELLPDAIYREFNTENATMMAVFFDSSTSADITMDAIRQIRAIAGNQCFVSGMSALVTDLKDLCEREEPVYVGLAVLFALLATITKAPKVQEIAVLFSGSYLSYNERETGLTVPCLSCHARSCKLSAGPLIAAFDLRRLKHRSVSVYSCNKAS